MQMDEHLKDVLEWLKFILTIATPLGVFWLGIISANKKRSLDTLHNNVSSLEKKIGAAQKECRGDIEAVTVQISAFQTEVAGEYARRPEIISEMRDLRNEIRLELRDLRNEIRSSK